MGSDKKCSECGSIMRLEYIPTAEDPKIEVLISKCTNKNCNHLIFVVHKCSKCGYPSAHCFHKIIGGAEYVDLFTHECWNCKNSDEQELNGGQDGNTINACPICNKK